MSDILNKILATKIVEVATAKTIVSPEAIQQLHAPKPNRAIL